jgi:hypothetical protein
LFAVERTSETGHAYRGRIILSRLGIESRRARPVGASVQSRARVGGIRGIPGILGNVVSVTCRI